MHIWHRPSVPALQAEYEKLQGQKETLYADYGNEKTGCGIRRYQAEHRQYFTGRKEARTGKGNRARIMS